MLLAHNFADYLKTDYCGPYAANLTEYEAWAELRDALNKTGRPIYYSICPKTVAPDYGTATPYAGQRVYSPPSNWTRDERAALANSILVEYVNLADTWYSPNASDCVNVGQSKYAITWSSSRDFLEFVLGRLSTNSSSARYPPVLSQILCWKAHPAA